MISKLPFKFSLTLLAFFIGFLSVSAQVSLREISLKEQIDNSSLVVEGKVIAKRSFWDADHRMIYTANTVEVYKVFKGDAVDAIEVLTQGGTIGLRAFMVSHSLKLREGSLGVFTLYDNDVVIASKNKTKSKQYKSYSVSQGFYKYDLNENKVTNKFSQRNGIESTFYNEVMSFTNTKYKKVSSFDVESVHKAYSQKNSLLPPASITFTPTTITAGTNSVLTIDGTGFGATKGKVGFRNSDDGGATYLDAFDSEVLTWSDTQITVEVPSHAGTGAIRVTDAASASSTSSATLTVSYAQFNGPYDLMMGVGMETSQTQHYDNNGSGGYTWEMQTEFFDDSEHPDAKAAFMRAFDNWRCESKINWEVSVTATTTDINSEDNENVIRFDNGTELGAGVLGTCYSALAGRLCSGVVVWYVSDLDIVFDSETSWYFGTGTFDPGEIDFETVALHELGHGHQLGHVINSSNVMHFDLPVNTSRTVLDVNSIAAANDVQTRSTGNQICGIPLRPLMTNYDGSCNLSIEDIDLDKGVVMYPNPASQQLFIKNVSAEKLERIVIFDVSGRMISDLDVSETSGSITLNLKNTSKGIYFVNIHSGPNVITKKLIVE